MTSLSSTENEMASPCVPSRSVVSNVEIFINTSLRVAVASEPPLPDGRGSVPEPLFFRRYGRIFRHAGFFLLALQEGHHLAEFAAHLFHLLIAPGFAHGQEFLAAGLVLLHPLAGKLAGLDLGEDLLHFGA